MIKHEELLSHIEKHVGEIDGSLGEIVPGSDVTVNLHIIKPTEKRECTTLVTTGMSDLPMKGERVDDELQFAELMICLPSTWPITKEELVKPENYWPLGFLRQTAHLPHLFEGWIDEGVIIPNEEPPIPFACNTELSSLLVMRPEKEGLRVFEKNGKMVNFYQLVPLYEDERKLAMKKGSQTLIHKLKKYVDTPYVLDIERKNTAKPFWKIG
ncbi:suppressor of fused domain protein [Priestia filamentosa]|uniref:suppressor of fused domain protein n=1 Tax=Priestia filamentosa TaxID=1402861 RepID=UPI00397CB9CB